MVYRDIELVQPTAPGETAVQCLLMVHFRKVVGQVTFEVCRSCGQGLITGLDVAHQFHRSGLGSRALSHLRTRYPGYAWRTTLERRLTRDLMHRMRVFAATGKRRCAHLAPPAPTDG